MIFLSKQRIVVNDDAIKTIRLGISQIQVSEQVLSGFLADFFTKASRLLPRDFESLIFPCPKISLIKLVKN